MASGGLGLMRVAFNRTRGARHECFLKTLFGDAATVAVGDSGLGRCGDLVAVDQANAAVVRHSTVVWPARPGSLRVNAPGRQAMIGIVHLALRRPIQPFVVMALYIMIIAGGRGSTLARRPTSSRAHQRYTVISVSLQAKRLYPDDMDWPP